MEKLLELILQKAIDHGGIDLWFFLFIFSVGITIYVLKKNALITFGKPAGRRRCDKYCDDHRLQKDKVTSLESDLAEMENGSTSNFNRLEKLMLNMDSKLDQRFEDVYSLLRAYSKDLSDHIGYCRGVQQSKGIPK